VQPARASLAERDGRRAGRERAARELGCLGTFARELDRVRLLDGGVDDDADTAADNMLFATQGVFVP
jgi:hypothetical protein